MKETTRMTVRQLCNTIDLLSPSMDDYLYVCDFQNDFYYISVQALERFCIPTNSFNQVVQMHEQFVYPPDFPALQMELKDLQNSDRCVHNMMYRWVSRDGKPVWINCRGYVVREAGQPLYMAGCINEIGARQKADNISGLLGEASMEAFVNKLQFPPKGFLLRIGIDRLKRINACLGVEYGDMLLHETAECIREFIVPGQLLYYITGDEFIILDFLGGTKEQGKEIYYKVREGIEHFIEASNYESVFTISAGLVMCDDMENFSYSNFMRLTEFALAEAKSRGRNRCYEFDQTDYERFLRRREMIRQLRRAINHDFDGFEAYFQPIYHNSVEEIHGAETLMRFHSPIYGLVSPAEFIPLLEETGLIIPAGRWILRQALSACKQIKQWIPDFRINVNLSPVQIMQSYVGDEIMAALEEFQLDSQDLIIELTESEVLESDTRFTKLWGEMKRAGIRLALDDFGSGYSNFRYLTVLNPDVIKVDRLFTLKAMESDFEYKLLLLFCEMVHNLNLHLCIEGTETIEQVQKIKTLMPEYIQGYYFGKPCPLDEFIAIIQCQASHSTKEASDPAAQPDDLVMPKQTVS